jgi:hypothetical protein
VIIHVDDDAEEVIIEEIKTRILAKAKGLEPTKINLWKVAFENYSESLTALQNLIYKR